MGLTDEQRAAIDAQMQAPADEAPPVQPDDPPAPLDGDEAATWEWLSSEYRAAKANRLEALTAWRDVELDIAQLIGARRNPRPPTDDERARVEDARRAHDDAAEAELAAAEALKAGVTEAAVEAWRRTTQDSTDERGAAG